MIPMSVDPSLQRLSLLIGEGPLLALQSSRAFVFGLGGVGSWCAEALARSGIGALVLVDYDLICETNVNRQLEALPSNVGKPKADEMAARIAAVSPRCRVTAVREAYSRDAAASFDISGGDYVIDAIDSIEAKLDLIEHAVSAGARLFSSMGAALKLDPTRLRVADIWDTQGCPLAKLVRSGLRKRGFTGHFPAVFSTEVIAPKARAEPVAGTCEPVAGSREPPDGESSPKGPAPKRVNGSAVHVTASAGMILAGLVVRDACGRGV